MGPREHLEWCGATRLVNGAPKVHFSAKMTKMPLVNPRFDRRSNEVKTLTKKIFSTVLHETQASQKFLTTLTKFDPKSIPMGLKTLSFDPTIITGWIQCHCEDYQILIPKTVHGSKLELERSRCHKNRDNTTIDAPLNSGSHNFWSDCWIFQFHTFLETGREDLFKSIKINPIRDHLKVAAFQEPLPRNLCQGYKKPRHPSDWGGSLLFFF